MLPLTSNMIIDLESKENEQKGERLLNPDPDEVYYSDDEIFNSDDEYDASCKNPFAEWEATYVYAFISCLKVSKHLY